MKPLAKQARMHVLTVETPWGWIGAAGESQRLRFMSLGHPHEAAAIRACANILKAGDWTTKPWHPPLTKMLKAYAAGKVVDFSEIELELKDYTSFQQAILGHCRKIPYGQTLSYGELAERAGAPRAARAVGSVMAKNRFPLVVPCHRVLASGGKLGGYSAAQGLSLKKQLLAMEAEAVGRSKFKAAR